VLLLLLLLLLLLRPLLLLLLLRYRLLLQTIRRHIPRGCDGGGLVCLGAPACFPDKG
jgi:hypothetical protein